MIVRTAPGGEQLWRKTGSQVDCLGLQFPGDWAMNFAAEVNGCNGTAEPLLSGLSEQRKRQCPCGKRACHRKPSQTVAFTLPLCFLLLALLFVLCIVVTEIIIYYIPEGLAYP